MEEILGIVLFLLLIGGASALRWWIEKQQREKEADDRARRPSAAPPSALPADRRPVFYDRAGEEPRFAVPEAEPTRLQAPVPLLTDLETLEAPPLQTSARRSARREAGPQPSPAPQAEPLKSPGTIKAAAPVAVSRAGPFLGSLLERENLAKAIVLSEILGPPKAFRDF
jgi:hypothetical protein